MAEELRISGELSKKERYNVLIPQVESLITGESDLIANLANISAALKETFNFLWVGFYRVCDNELVLGPFQGPIACTRIAYGKGVCGAAWKARDVIVVPDVDAFPGHIACSSASRSEIVLPIVKNDNVVWVLDVDSRKLSDFDEEDKHGLAEIVRLIENIL